jgi:hypothetical protein
MTSPTAATASVPAPQAPGQKTGDKRRINERKTVVLNIGKSPCLRRYSGYREKRIPIIASGARLAREAIPGTGPGI